MDEGKSYAMQVASIGRFAVVVVIGKNKQLFVPFSEQRLFIRLATRGLARRCLDKREEVVSNDKITHADLMFAQQFWQGCNKARQT